MSQKLEAVRLVNFVGSVNKMLRRFGIQVKRYPDADVLRRMRLVTKEGIDVLLDVGANAGQYGSLMRELGYDGKIVSFEPLGSAFKLLQRRAERDKLWRVENYGLGSVEEICEINVSANSYSSSLLDIMPAHTDAAAESQFVGRQPVQIRTLDYVFDEFCGVGDKVMLKVDTQGFEKMVLEGASNSLHRVALVQLEMSMIPLYRNEALFLELIEYMKERGFRLCSLENGFSDMNTGQLLQVDGLFARFTG